MDEAHGVETRGWLVLSCHFLLWMKLRPALTASQGLEVRLFPPRTGFGEGRGCSEQERAIFETIGREGCHSRGLWWPRTIEAALFN